MITYNVDGVKMPKIKKRDTSAWIRAVAATYNLKVGEIGYMFVDDEKILEVNNEYLGHDYYTDVITFDYDEPALELSQSLLQPYPSYLLDCYALL